MKNKLFNGILAVCLVGCSYMLYNIKSQYERLDELDSMNMVMDSLLIEAESNLVDSKRLEVVINDLAAYVDALNTVLDDSSNSGTSDYATEITNANCDSIFNSYVLKADSCMRENKLAKATEFVYDAKLISDEFGIDPACELNDVAKELAFLEYDISNLLWGAYPDHANMHLSIAKTLVKDFGIDYQELLQRPDPYHEDFEFPKITGEEYFVL